MERSGEQGQENEAKGGYKTIGSWVGSTAKTVAAWTHPFRSLETQNKKKREKFSPWFSLFVDEICRTRNNANGIDVDFNVLPFTPLAPGGALKFLLDNGITSFSLHDPSGQRVEMRLEEDKVHLLAGSGEQLSFTYTGERISAERGNIELALPRAHLNPPVLSLTERAGYLKAKQQEAVEAWSDNSAQEDQAWSDEDAQDYESRSQENAQGRWSGSDEEAQETSTQSDDCALKMAPEAYHSALLKLLIIKLHGIKKALYLQKTPSNPTSTLNLELIPSLMQDEVYIRWMEIDKEKEWGVMALLKSIGIHPWNANLLISEGATAKEIISWYLYVFTIPAQKITASRESVLVASLKESPNSPYPGPFERLASLPPEKLQDLFRRAIRSYGGRVGDLDWDHALAEVKVMDLALLAERLGLARIIREAGT